MILTDFLLARIAETKATAREDDTAHLAPVWTDYILAECDAKRRIVEQFQQAEADDEMPAEWNDGYVCGQEFTLRLLALPYADHPDYDEQWRP